MTKSIFLAVLTVMTVLLALTFGRQWYDSLLVRVRYHQTVHSDNSVIKTGIHSQVPPQVTLVYKNQAGQMVRVIANSQDYSTFVNQQVATLEKAKAQLLTQTEKHLHAQLTEIFNNLNPYIDRFADWYFAYPTTYQILWEATASATQHALSVEAMSLTEAVAYDVEAYLHQHYEQIVLRPEVTDPQLQATFREVLHTAHRDYLTIVSSLQTEFQAFLARSTTLLTTPAPGTVELTLDWESQWQKINLAEYEKGVKGATVGATLIAGGAVAGKTVASAAGKSMAGKTVASATSKGLLAKFSAPFVSKAVLAGSGGAVGTLGGPLGTVIGAATGLGIDYILNEGMELTQREAFLADVKEALTTTQKEWETAIGLALQEAIKVWIEDTVQSLPKFYKENHP